MTRILHYSREAAQAQPFCVTPLSVRLHTLSVELVMGTSLTSSRVSTPADTSTRVSARYCEASVTGSTPTHDCSLKHQTYVEETLDRRTKKPDLR